MNNLAFCMLFKDEDVKQEVEVKSEKLFTENYLLKKQQEDLFLFEKEKKIYLFMEHSFSINYLDRFN